MTIEELFLIAKLAAIILCIWHLIKRNVIGFIFSIVVTIILITQTNTISLVINGILCIPIIIEERWHPRAKMDLVRGILVGVIFAVMIALLYNRIVFK